jgi:predicted fused transcriptional regulator/phosphomethylpyrimidine kinase
MFHVEISGSDSETRFDVTGVDGRIIQQGEWNTNAGQVDLSSYPTGMYLLKIVQQDRIVTRRLIKM